MGEEIASIVDEEVRQIVWGAYERTTELLTEKKELAAALAQRLLENEVLLREDVIEILGERPWNDAMTYQELVGKHAKEYVPNDPPPPEEADLADADSPSESSGSAMP